MLLKYYIIIVHINVYKVMIIFHNNDNNNNNNFSMMRYNNIMRYFIDYTTSNYDTVT